tara:strand:+ start:343 stop:588 length:246 start_codon:yes stop_codon:yes gene_type:complete
VKTMPIISMPLPDGGAVVCRVDAIKAATTNLNDDNLTDIYVEIACPDGITVDVDIDTFTTSWLSALLLPVDDWGLEVREMH